MLSETIRFCKRAYAKAMENKKDLYLVVVVVLVAIISFGLGRLSKIREEKTPIIIENTALNAISASSSVVKVDTKKATIDKAEMIFVASKNGKKYYFMWCESAKIIKDQNRVWFSSKEEAEKAGYEPAANCKGLQ